MARFELRSASEAETARLGECLAPLLQPGDVVSLSGDLGAGKTRLVQGVAAGLGVKDHVTSPTFGLLAVHPGRLDLYHFDLYRLEDESQLEDVDFWGVLESGGASFVEWGDRFPAALPAEHLSVEMRMAGPDDRVLTAVSHGPRGHVLAEAWVAACEPGPGGRGGGGEVDE
ncbi:MAG: tRNA (adenosine(37)-N6)-threonylcarbamoyltransferase complex ATPase subunit type 1 TsaE [Coriobacteriia bacterium]|nr:tRNA (adenosine(37)-N6)-threonylcarbamoyltransferase complex ATPase subunit type 1 TsaE [Coriobacteriia bacterium]